MLDIWESFGFVQLGRLSYIPDKFGKTSCRTFLWFSLSLEGPCTVLEHSDFAYLLPRSGVKCVKVCFCY